MDHQLYAAAEVGDWEVIRRYQNQLSSQLTPNKDTVLHILAQFSDSSSTAQQIISTTPKLLLALDADNRTPLHHAAREGHSDVVGALLECAKQSNQIKSLLRSADRYGNLAIHEAANGNYQGIVEIMIKENPIIVYFKNKEKRCPLYVAVEKGNHGVAEAILLNYKRKVEDGFWRICMLFSGENPLSPFVCVPVSPTNQNLLYKYLFQLYIHMVNCDWLGTRGHTQMGTEDFLPLFSTDIGIGPDGKTVLHAAATANSPATLIGLVCEKLPDLTEKVDALGYTPLHYAARLNHHEVAKELLLERKTMAYVKSFKYQAGFFRTLLSHAYEYVPETAFHVAVIHGQMQVIEELLSICPDCWQMVTIKNKNAIHLAVEYEQQQVLDFMLGKPWASILINQKDSDGNTPLHWYASTTNLVGHNLLNHPRVDKNATNSQGLTPFDSLIYPCSGINLTRERQDLIREELVGIGAATSKVRIHRRNVLDKRTRETYLVVAVLLVTVTFTPIFQPPGGYDSENGKPVMLDSYLFLSFLNLDITAFLLSITAVIGLLYLPETYLLWFYSSYWMMYAFVLVLFSFMFGVSCVKPIYAVLAIVYFLFLCFFDYVILAGRLHCINFSIITKMGVK